MPEAMNGFEYINSVIKGIKNKNEKTKLNAELSDHIETSRDFYKEIGYTEREAERKAVANMGESAVVSEQFCHIYNKSSKAAENTLSAVLLLILSLTFSTLHLTAPELGCADTFISLGFQIVVFYLFSAAALKKHSIFISVITITFFLVLGCYSVYAPMMSAGFVQKPADFIDPLVYISAIILFLPMLANCIYTFIYSVKIKKLKNTRRNLKQCKIQITVTVCLAVAVFLLSIIGCIKLYFDTQEMIEIRNRDFEQACKISQEIAFQTENTDKPIEDILDEKDINYDKSGDGFYSLCLKEESGIIWHIDLYSTDEIPSPCITVTKITTKFYILMFEADIIKEETQTFDLLGSSREFVKSKYK